LRRAGRDAELEARLGAVKISDRPRCWGIAELSRRTGMARRPVLRLPVLAVAVGAPEAPDFRANLERGLSEARGLWRTRLRERPGGRAIPVHHGEQIDRPENNGAFDDWRAGAE